MTPARTSQTLPPPVNGQAHEQLTQMVDTLVTILKPRLSSAERRSRLRVRRNGEHLVPELIALAMARPQLAPNAVKALGRFAAGEALDRVMGE